MTNTTQPDDENGNFGIRISLPDGDPFTRLVDDGWTATHWYASRTARDLAMSDMRREHEYSRSGDAPALVFEAIERND